MKHLLTIYKDKKLTQPHNPQYEVEIKGDKARMIASWGGAWGMAKKSRFNNLNNVVTVTGGKGKSYKIYYLTAMSQKVYFKILQK